MKEIIKKILKVIGNEEFIFIGKKEEGIPTIKLDEVELHKKKYKNIIIESLNSLDIEEIKRLYNLSDRLWIILPLQQIIEEADSTVEKMLSEKEFKTDVNNKIEDLKKISQNILVANFDLPEVALIIPKKEKPINVKTKPFSSFLLTLSIVEYLKAELERIKREKEEMKAELERIKREKEDLERIKGELKEAKSENLKLLDKLKKLRNQRDKEINDIWKKHKKRIKEISKGYKKEIVKLLKDIERLKEEFNRKEGELQKIRKEFENELRKKDKEFQKLRKEFENELKKKEIERKNIEEKYKNELQKLVVEMGIKIEEKEEEIRMLKRIKKGSK